ncbi:MAG: methyltransferase, partial [Oscillospiraceae bacterium]
MSAFICPICKAILVADDKTLKCNAGHSFDVSKYGYVNLLISQKTGVHGDDKLMVAARTRFLSKGF